MSDRAVVGPAAPGGSVSRHAAWTITVRGAADVVARLSTLAWMIVAVRVLDQGEFGVVSYSLSIMLLVSAIPSWGFDTALMHKGSIDPDRLAVLSAQVLRVKTVVGAVTFLVTGVVFSANGMNGTDVVVLSVVLACGLPELWSHTARAASVARQEPLGMSVALVVQRLSIAVLVVLALLLGMREVGVAAGILLGTLLGWSVHAVALRRLGIRLRGLPWDRQDRREAMRGTFLIGISAVTLTVLFRIDGVLLGVLQDTQAVAAYAVAYRLVETALLFSHAINQAIFPVMSSSTTTARVRRGYEKALSVAAFVYLPFAVVAVVEGDRVLGLLFGGTYASASSAALAWLAPAPLLFAAAYFGITVLAARERHRDMVVAALCATAVNLVANLLLIPPLAGTGAAIATSGSFLVQVVVVHALLRRRGIAARVGRPVMEVAVAAVALGATLFLLDAPLVLELAAGAFAFLTSWLLLARHTAPDQVQLARQLLGGRRRRG